MSEPSRPSSKAVPRQARAKARPEVDLETLLPGLEAMVQEKGVLKRSELRKQKIPPTLGDEVFERLASRGFERIKDGIRVPLGIQLASLLQESGAVALTAARKRLKGSSPKETRDLIGTFVQKGMAALAIRGKVEVLCDPSIPVLARDEVRALGRATTALAAQARKAAGSPTLPKTLLRDDVSEALLEFLRPFLPAPPSKPRLSVADEVVRLLRPGLGLCFVPDLVLRMAADLTLPQIHAALMEAARARLIELRPESGLARLSPVELALCPQGLQETRLSWARPLREARP